MMLLGLIVLIAALKWAFAVSDKLKPATWQLLAIAQAALFVLSVWGLQASPKTDNGSTGADTSLKPNITIWRDVRWNSSRHRTYALIIGNNAYADDLPLDIQTWSYSTDVNDLAEFKARIDRASQLAGLHADDFHFPDPGRFFDRKPSVVVQPSPSEGRACKDSPSWVSILVSAILAITSLASMAFSWATYYRTRREAVLMRLEIIKKRMEIEQLRRELDQSKRNPPPPPPSLIIIP